MPKAIISDTSCFIILTNIGELELLSEKIELAMMKDEVLASSFLFLF